MYSMYYEQPEHGNDENNNPLANFMNSMPRMFLGCARSNETSPRDYPRRMSYETFMKDRDSTYGMYGLSTSSTRSVDNQEAEYSPVGTIMLPDDHNGCYRKFCPPEKYASAFSVPGEFTFKFVTASVKSGRILHRLALICGWIIGADGISRGEYNQRMDSYVKFIEKDETQLRQFAEDLAFRFPGHKLTTRLPAPVSVLTAYSHSALQQRGTCILKFLTYLLQITEVGHNRLVKLKHPVARDGTFRNFFDLPMWDETDFMVTATSSCSGRIERHKRPKLPMGWFTDNNDSDQPQMEEQRKSNPNQNLPPPHPNSHPHHTVDYDFRSSLSALNQEEDSDFIDYRAPRSTGIRCTTFVKPSEWARHGKYTPGAFTVEISQILVHGSVATYKISLLYYEDGSLKIREIVHRFTDFYSFTVQLSSKFPKQDIFRALPPKTFMRYVSPKFLEDRSARLQFFLEKLLSMSFEGLLGQQIQMVAEPSVRHFLELPVVEWNLVPASQPLFNNNTTMTYSSTASPTTPPPSSPSFTSDEYSSKPAVFGRKRSGSF